MGYIDSFEEIMAMETGFLQYAMKLLKEDYAKELEILKVELPDASRIPAVRFDVAKELVAKKYNRQIRNPFDLEPEEEASSVSILKKNIMQILFLLPIIHLRSVRSTQWMIQRIPDLR